MKFKLYKGAKKIFVMSAAIALITGIGVFTARASYALEKNEVGVETYIVLNDASADIKGNGAQFDFGILTLKNAGTYYLSGKLSDGQIVVDSDGDVEIVLNGVNINNSKGPAIYGKNGDMSIKVQGETKNYLSDGESYLELDENEEPNACVFSHDRITVKGAGELTITANYEDGIGGKDEIKINNSILTVNALDDGIRGKDYVELNGGTVTVNTQQGDGIKSTKGYIVVNDGSYTISSFKKGFESADTLTINGGNIDVANCTEGFEGVQVIINDGSIHINASDDGINASDGLGNMKGMGGFRKDMIFSAEGTEMPKMPPNAEMPDMPPNAEMPEIKDNMMPHKDFENKEKMENNTEMTPPKNFENMEDNKTKTDDEVDNADKKECIIEINGGYTYVNAKGDGIDSNGTITFNGGTVIVNGPTSNGDGALDSERGISYNGGTVIAVGSAGMVEAPKSENSNGYTLNFRTSEIAAGTLVSILDENDNVLAAFKPVNNISSIVFSSELISENKTLYIYTDGEYSGNLSKDNFAQGGVYTKGNLLEKVEITDKTTAAGNAPNNGFDRFNGFDMRCDKGQRKMNNVETSN